MPVLGNMECKIQFLDDDYHFAADIDDITKSCTINDGSNYCNIDFFTFTNDVQNDVRDIYSYDCHCKVIIYEETNSNGRGKRFHIDPHEFIRKDSSDDHLLADDWDRNTIGSNAKGAKVECWRPRMHNQWT